MDKGDVAILIVGIVVIALIAFLFWVFLRFVWRSFLSAWKAVFGPSFVAAMAGLGIAVWLFPVMIVGPAKAAMRLVESFFSIVPKNIAALIQAVQSGDISTHEKSVSALIQSFGSDIAQAIEATSFPVVNLVLGFATWVIAAHVVTWAMTTAPVGPFPIMARVGGFFGGLQLPTKRNIALCFIIFTGCYLTIAAIAAIPFLQETTFPAEIDTTHLKESLKAAGLSQDEFNQRFPKELPDTDPFSSLEELLKASQPGSPAQGASTPSPAAKNSSQPSKASQSGRSSANDQKILSSANSQPTDKDIKASADNPTTAESGIVHQEDANLLQETLVSGETERKRLRQMWTTLRDDIWSRQEKLQTEITEIFNVENVGRSGTQARARYYGDLLIYYRDEVQAMSNRMDRCRGLIAEADGFWNEQSSELVTFARTRATAEERTFGWQFIRTVSGTEVCTLYETALVRPSYRDPGQSWGIFIFVADWLIRTQSLALAVISGMIGAGLLGSAVSTFLVGRVAQVGGSTSTPAASATQEDHALDLVGVVVKGFSAGIVVYLAVKGGMAVFGSSSGEPNPYVLLLMCLVGTVYSDDIWKWARNKLRTRFSPDPQEQTSNGGEVAGKDKDKSTSDPPKS